MTGTRTEGRTKWRMDVDLGFEDRKMALLVELSRVLRVWMHEIEARTRYLTEIF